MGVDHYENFPVASVLSPPALRPAIVAIYHFARTADDLADEGDSSASARLADLDEYRRDLHRIYAGLPPGPRWRTIFAALDDARRRHSLPLPLLEALLDAFAHDAVNPRHDDRDSLLWYCQRSANPVGRLLLHLYDVDDPESLARSDDICTALQLINFWQDLGRDLPRGRLYLPLSDLHRHDLDPEALMLRPTEADPAPLRRLLAELLGWSVAMMRRGAPLALQLPGRIGWELRLVVQGGLRVAEKIAAGGHRPWLHRPRITAWDLPRLLWRAASMTDREGRTPAATS